MDDGPSHHLEDIDEKSVILRCQNGDKQAYGVLVKKYMKQAYFTALGLVGSHDNALDLSQEAFVKAFRSLDKFDANKKFYTWYYRILRNLCFNYLRDKARHARTFSEMGAGIFEILDKTQDVSQELEREEVKRAVWKGLAMLKEYEREIIILKDFQEMSYKKIAEILDRPIGTVMSRLYNARKALKVKLEGLLI